ncbi:MAG: cation-transporting P-type ATPase [Parcubacteria group bacterium]|jgi:potassium/sodium efflux P-type ATPase
MPKENKNIYNLTSDEVLKRFDASLQGLSIQEAEKRLREFGANKLQRKQNWKWLKLIWNQFNDALVWILLVAAGLAALFREWRDVTIILIIVAINSIIGFLQEFKAERILDSIKKLTTDKAVVIRGGVRQEIEAAELVVGDVVALTSGDSVPADGYLIEAYDLRVNSFIFTGESKPETKKVGVMENHPVLADIDNMVFSGETIATGEAKFVVTGTGMGTELGKIANLTQEVKEDLTPMQKQMRSLGRQVTILSILIGVVVMIAGQYFKMSLYDNFLFALALAVSVVPEGLPAAISVALSLGMKRLLKENVLAKKLNAVETLGSVNIICTDKTGTITKNELMVTRVVVNDEILEVSGSGYEPVGNFSKNGKIIKTGEIENLELLMRIGTLCNGASLLKEGGQWKIIGDPTEGAIVVVGKKYNDADGYFVKGETKITENPFSSERMRMSVVYKGDLGVPGSLGIVSYVKGSPDVLLELCTQKKVGDKISEFTPAEKEQTKEIYNQMSAQALRVLAFAYRELPSPPAPLPGGEGGFSVGEAEKNLIWVGMMAMIDPPRLDVTAAIAECKTMDIKVIMITGDYEITAKAIAKNIGLIDDKNKYEIINGKTLSILKDREVYQKIKAGDVVFARIAPEQKLRIATILKNNKQVIAMTGDGVNDAPALKYADIGVAMGIIGTDVSKEAGDMILLDDNFASIVHGIKEGRTIFQNLKKFVHYVLTSNASELLTVIFGVLLQIPAPIMAVQILSIDLATDVFPSFSLGLEPPEPGTDKKVINSKGAIIGWKGFRRIIYLGIIMATAGTVAFLWSMLRGGWYFGEAVTADMALYVKSTTVTYAVLAMTQMANLLQSRSEKLSPFELGFFKNKYAIGSIFISIAILLSFMYVPLLQKYLHMSPIDWKDWLAVVVSVIAVFLWEQGRKAEEK